MNSTVYLMRLAFRARPLSPIARPSRKSLLLWKQVRWGSVAPLSSEQEITNVEHAQFISEGSPGAKWKERTSKANTGPTREEIDSVPPGKGKLSPTTSHLFKLILPLNRFAAHDEKEPPTVFLLHPSQPLSHVSRLICGSLPSPSTWPDVSFRSTSSVEQDFRWSDSTDVGDFIKDAAKAASFSIHIKYPSSDDSHKLESKEVIEVQVPTFADRTRYIRRQLREVENKLKSMEGLKRECDQLAQRGAKRIALSGFGGLVLYWATVCRLTFYDYGWDVMEPVTYLSGLSTVICGYLWFLYQGREVSYSSVLDRSISSRREALYKSRGLDIELWVDLIAERRELRREIKKIAQDYDHTRDSSEDKGEDVEEATDYKRDKMVAEQARKGKKNGQSSEQKQ